MDPCHKCFAVVIVDPPSQAVGAGRADDRRFDVGLECERDIVQDGVKVIAQHCAVHSLALTTALLTFSPDSAMAVSRAASAKGDDHVPTHHGFSGVRGLQSWLIVLHRVYLNIVWTTAKFLFTSTLWLLS